MSSRYSVVIMAVVTEDPEGVMRTMKHTTPHGKAVLFFRANNMLSELKALRIALARVYGRLHGS